MKKAVAPAGYAAMSVAERDTLWAGDTQSARSSDAWAALDNLTEATFRDHFERNDPSGNEYPTIYKVTKATLGPQRSIYVEYDLTNASRGVAVRIHSHYILYQHHWFSVNMATQASEPTYLRSEMDAAAQTFRLSGAP